METSILYLDRCPIYARLGIPELWCYNDGTLNIYLLQNGQYQRRDRSQVFPQLAIQALSELAEVNRGEGRLALRRAVRQWVNTQIDKG